MNYAGDVYPMNLGSWLENKLNLILTKIGPRFVQPGFNIIQKEKNRKVKLDDEFKIAE